MSIRLKVVDNHENAVELEELTDIGLQQVIYECEQIKETCLFILETSEENDNSMEG